MVELQNRTAVVTGATRGVGRLCCRRLAAEGMRLVPVARTQAALEELAEELRRDYQVDVLPVPADLTDEAQAAAVPGAVTAAFGTPYLLVNSMNIDNLQGGPFEQSTVQQFDRVMRTKPLAYYLAMRAFLPEMLEAGEGCVVNLVSGAGVSGSPGYALFSAAEFALIGMSDSVARETQARGVHVSTLSPWGFIDSERVRALVPERDPAGFMDPEDLVDAILFLARRSPRAWVRHVIVRAPSAVD